MDAREKVSSKQINYWLVIRGNECPVEIENYSTLRLLMMISIFKITFSQPCFQKMYHLILVFFGIYARNEIIVCRSCPMAMTNIIDISWFRNKNPSKELKADRPHPRDYPPMPPNYRHTDKTFGLVKPPFTYNLRVSRRARTNRHGHTQTDGRYQFYYLSASRSIIKQC